MDFVSSDEIPTEVGLQNILREHQDVIFRIAWSPRGDFLASPSRDTTIKVWNTKTGDLYRDLKGHTLRVNSIDWSRDGTQLVSCGSDGIVALWDLQQTSPAINIIKRFTNSSGVIPVFDIAWASDIGLFAAACRDGNVRLWSSKQSDTVRNLAATNAYINCVAWSPNEQYLATGSGDRKVRIWEVSQTGEPELVWQVNAHQSPVNSIAWSPDSQLLVSVGKQTVKVWDIKTQNKLKELEIQPDLEGFIKSVDFSYDGKLIAAKCQSSEREDNNVIKILAVDAWQIIATIPETTTPKAATGIAFHRRMPILATQGEHDTVIRLWDVKNLDVSDSSLVEINTPKIEDEADDGAISNNDTNLETSFLPSSKITLPPWIFGMHDLGDWRDLVEQSGKKAWVMCQQVVGHDPLKEEGNSFLAEWQQNGYGVLVRLVNAPFSLENQGGGSIPLPDEYEHFAVRCAKFVQNSPGCKIWLVGEEMNISWHWPSQKGTVEPISPANYARCFKLVRDAIKQVQADAWVIPSGLNPLTSPNPNAKHEDALQWFGEMLNLIDELDGFDIHSYFPPQGFYSYKEFIQKIPQKLQHLPIFLTETTPPDMWPENANGWMQETYKEIDEWNSHPEHQNIYAVLPYRWQGTSPEGHPDPWNLVNRPSYREDFSEALTNNYRWRARVPNLPISPQKNSQLEDAQADQPSTDQNDVNLESSTNDLSLSKNEVVQVQKLLTQAGHSVSIDGDYGQQTRSAIKQFQAELGVTSTGVVTPSFIQLLRLQPPPSNDRIRIEISADTINLDYNNGNYSNPNRLAQYAEALSVAELEANWKKYGELLFEAIINDESNEQGIGDSVLTGYRNARSQISNQRLRIELDLDPNRINLHQYKWEYLKDPKNDVPLAVYEHSPLYRCPKNGRNQDPAEAKPLRILVVICNPSTLKDPTSQGAGFSPALLYAANNPVEQLVKIDVLQEKAILKTGLQRLQKEDLIEYTFLDETENGPRTTLDNLIAELREKPYHILHIVAHGFLMGDSFMLVMENSDGKHDCVDAKKFSSAMFPDSLRLVVFASCQTAQTDSENVIRGLGARLSNLGVPAVIAMQDLVPVPTAQLFTQYFYDHLARSGRIDMAMAATRFDLYRRRGGETGDWGIPVLFMTSGSSHLFDVDRQKACNVNPLQPEVKTYDQLPGRGNPRPQVLASTLESLARQHHLNPEQISLLSSLAASLRPNTPPLALPQNRLALQEKIQKDLKVDPIQPDELESAATLSLPSYVYGQIASALNTGKHIILIGPPGTGKTTIAHDICQYVKQKSVSAGYISTTATADWTTFDTIGGYTPTPQQTLEFRLGIFLQAIAQGQWLVIDEINRSDIDKSFGELFTVLSGQQVDLPYTINDQPVRVLPAKEWQAYKDDRPDNYTYVVHPNWRVIGTMNVYDKSSLFNLSFAFMRRFAFIEIDVPDHQIYQDKLLTTQGNGWFAKWKEEKKDLAELDQLRSKLLDLLRLKDIDGSPLLANFEPPLTANPLMSSRAIGPAIIKDMVDYIGDRHQSGEDIIGCLGEAFLLYLSPQLDGIAQDTILDIYRFIQVLFEGRSISSSILNRIELFYPHIREWPR